MNADCQHTRKIVIGIPCLGTGGTEMHTCALARVLVNGGFEVVVCCYYEYDEGMVTLIEQTGAKVLRLGLSRRGPGKNIDKMPRLAWQLSKVLRREKPLAFHIQYLAPGALAALAGRLSGPWRQVITLHTPGHVYGRRTPALRWVARRLCDAFVCVSETAESALFEDSAIFDSEMLGRGRRHFAIPNCVNLERIDVLRQASQSEDLRRRFGLSAGPVIGCVARLNAEKGQSFLLDGFAQVRRTLPDAQLVLVGDGDSRSELEKQVQRLELNGAVIFTGWQKPEDALTSYSVMDVVAVPSLFEGFGLSAAEAMAFAKPVVGTGVDGLRNVVRPGETGFLVEYGNVQELADRLITLLSDSRKATGMGRAGRVRVEQHFSMEVFRQRWISLYESLEANS